MKTGARYLPGAAGGFAKKRRAAELRAEDGHRVEAITRNIDCAITLLQRLPRPTADILFEGIAAKFAEAGFHITPHLHRALSRHD